ncbi:unnamed protein product [Arabidopsis lyrata]|uniref:uncharacterized protein LOC110224802 n=1 Tax=Arabidopsis lyrata subsp. lyrata TaxID=81972 RepID=UPI000A29CE72|nr:uncharacterized protein LOC110224802 [Arabidopsis lyrata subsp. lyrata]CAH8251541.1 unnamed protein product [Arabidopsis lyrata]|eukprot:XP_020867703.1 uncharacterized protein LOC110224802 [Arabidopsis lyrata subsp. lyrata]
MNSESEKMEKETQENSTGPDASSPPTSSTPSSSSKSTCALCLDEMKKGDGKAIFTAECSHSFHFDCINSNVRYGNRICPLCRTQWKQVPFFHGNPFPQPQQVPLFHGNRQVPLFHGNPFAPAQMGFEDDESLPHGETQIQSADHPSDRQALEIKLFPEVSALAKPVSRGDFAALVHLKAEGVSDDERRTRAPLDLIAVLDVSGSMAGVKLELVKKAMGFVIQNLGETDRLSVISFSSTAQRLFPLRLMSETRKQAAMKAVNSLVARGGTNIAEGLKIGARVIEDRRWKNPVSGMMLLSDGQDNYTFSHDRVRLRTDYESLLPSSSRIPTHTFGFGSDHDAELLNAISAASSGTFSFIEAETMIQDAFAQCIGGLLSVVILDQVVEIECVHEQGLKISSIKSGSYKSRIASDERSAKIDVGAMYAEEERDLLVILGIPCCDNVSAASDSLSLLKVRCVYKDPFTKEIVRVEAGELSIQRPMEVTGEEVVSIEVDRELNRFLVAQAMSEARDLADGGNLSVAVEILKKCERELSETASARSGDGLCKSLSAELSKLQERMGSQMMYEGSGRAYMYSTMSSLSAQRAVACGTKVGCIARSRGMGGGGGMGYQTSAMARMVNKSQKDRKP